MSDFEDAFGAGADAAEIINGNARSAEWNEIKEQWHRDFLKRQAELEADPEHQAREARLIAYEAQRDAERKATQGRHLSPILADREQDARRRAIERATRAQAEHLAKMGKHST